MESLLQRLRAHYKPKLPSNLKHIHELKACVDSNVMEPNLHLKDSFPHTYQKPFISYSKHSEIERLPLRVGVVLSGGQAAGGHNVITGIFDALKRLNPQSHLFGFMNGPSGIVENKFVELTGSALEPYRNQGGFDLIGSGRTKIETSEQFEATLKTVQNLKLDGLIVIGGDDSNTNAALLAEYFEKNKVTCSVIGVPKTIDGDLKNRFIEASFGFDTAAKTFADIIGNVARDALSSKKYYFFVKLMGRSASHIALECALQTHPNLTLISEEIAEKKMTIADITDQISDLICERSLIGKHYGVILIPEGIIEFIPEFKQLIKELNGHLGKDEKIDTPTKKLELINKLTAPSAACFQSISEEIQNQLLLDRDPHGNIQVSKIESERLFIETVNQELKRRKAQGDYKGKFSAQALFCGYEGRSCLPSNFDSQYCYALGQLATLLVNSKANGYICAIRHLYRPVEDWQLYGVPLVSLIHLEERMGKIKPVIEKALVDLDGKVFEAFKKKRDEWRTKDHYRYPGPIQFFGPKELTECVTLTLEYETTASLEFARPSIDLLS